MIDISKGRIISSHGYVKLLMPKHPEADSNGFRFTDWLFGTDSDGDYRFCLLVAEFMEEKDESK